MHCKVMINGTSWIVMHSKRDEHGVEFISCLESVASCIKTITAPSRPVQVSCKGKNSKVSQMAISGDKAKCMFGHQFFVFPRSHQTCLATCRSVRWDFPSLGRRRKRPSVGEPHLDFGFEGVIRHIQPASEIFLCSVCKTRESPKGPSRGCTVGGVWRWRTATICR